jgi:hypothetical protein
MGKTDRIYLKFEGLDWDDDEAIEAFAKSLHGALVDRLDLKREFRSQERDEKEGENTSVGKSK